MVIKEQTSIAESLLFGFRRSSEYTIAQRMSWAATRETARKENVAYCLMGIFDVNMPLLYGEGDKAFLRLQQEIIRNSKDQSIFAWEATDASHPGLLARGPSAFSGCNRLYINHRYKPEAIVDRAPELYWTNRGLALRLWAWPVGGETFLAFLGCTGRHEGRQASGRGLFLRKLKENDEYARVKDQLHDSGREDGILERLYRRTKPSRIVQFIVPQDFNAQDREYYEDHVNGFHIIKSQFMGRPGKHFDVQASNWDPATRTLVLPERELGTIRALSGSTLARDWSSIKLDFDYYFNVIIFMVKAIALASSKRTVESWDVYTSENSWSTTSDLGESKVSEVANCPGAYALKIPRLGFENTRQIITLNVAIEFGRRPMQGGVSWIFRATLS